MSIKCCIVMFSTAAALLFCAPSAVAANPAYERGLDAASNYRYSEALMHFTTAAEQGDRNAQRNLGLMLLYGDLLYGRDFLRDRDQAKRWLQMAAAQGCDISTFMLNMLAQHGR
jgi:TPR repeat protein